MADVITRFKLETTQYDSKLRDAAKSLSAYSKQAELAGKDFDKFTKSGIEAAKAFGAVESGAKNTKDRLKDLVGAYNDVARAYNNLTEQQRQSDFGKAMAQSLSQLQDRIKETKDELYSLGDTVKNSSGLFGEGGLTGMLQVFGGNMMTKAAEYIAGLGSEVVQVTMQSMQLAREAEGVTNAFARLNKPGLLDNLKEATHGTVSELELMKAAVKFEDFKLPVEELGVLLSFAQQKAKDTGQSVDYMVDSIVTGLGRKSLMILDNLGISAAQVKDKMKETGDMTKAVGEIIREEMAKAGEYVDTTSDQMSRANAKLEDEMLALGRAMQDTFGISGVDELATKIKTELVGAITFTIETINEAKSAWQGFLGLMGIGSGKKQPSNSHLNAPRPNGTYVEQTDSDGNVRAGHWYNGQIAWDTAGVEIVGTKRDKTKKTGGGGSRGGKKTPSVQDYLNTMYGNMDDSLGSSLKGNPDKYFKSPFAMITEEDKRKMMEMTDVTVDLGDAMARLGEKQVTEDIAAKMQQMTKAAQAQKTALNLAGQAAQNFGAALESIGDPSAKAAGQVVSAIASIAMGFAMASSSANTAGTGWGWLAWLGAGLAAMTTTISTIHSLTGYAEGGIVKGNSYSGDNILANGGTIGLNAGEVVLTKAMQGNLASQLQGGGLQNMRLEGVITGENLHIIHNRYLQRTGQGELVTW